MWYRFILLCVFSFSLHAVELELTQGINSALPIAIDSFQQQGQYENIAEVLAHDLNFSGQFRIVAGPSDRNLSFNTGSLRRMGADTLVKGEVHAKANGLYEVSFDLIDVVNQGQTLLSRNYTVNPARFRALAHHIADEVYQKLTGEKGIFSTRIAYILVKNKQGKKQFSLEIADADGHNPHSLLVSPEPLMSPSWSPDGKKIAYVSFEKKRSQIYVIAIETGKRQLITSFPGINGAPAWSPDGKQLAVVLSKGGNPNIYLVDLNNGRMKQLTDSYGIDTEPSFAPDGKSLIFTSGRGGAPQIYQLFLDSGKQQRLTFDGNYNARPSFTADQKHIVMIHRNRRGFNIGVFDLKRALLEEVTSSSMDESPSLAPNGRLILYATNYKNRGVLGIVSIDGRIKLRLPAREGDVQEPAWSPFV